MDGMQQRKNDVRNAIDTAQHEMGNESVDMGRYQPQGPTDFAVLHSSSSRTPTLLHKNLHRHPRPRPRPRPPHRPPHPHPPL
eukprot:804256-Rhodomonas_salina.3